MTEILDAQVVASPTLTERQASILRAVVDGYVTSSRPVGSGFITENTALNVSSATIRKELLALEDGGYLLQPHTSAGRIPTDKGYRYYVDTIVAPNKLGGGDSRMVSSFFDKAHGELERLLGQTSELLAGLTTHTAMLIGPDPDLVDVRSAQIVSIAPSVALVVVVSASGRVDKYTLDIDPNTSVGAIDSASRYLAATLVGSPVGTNIIAARSGDATVDALVATAIAAVDVDVSKSSVYLGGTSRVAADFETIETVRGVLAVLEKQLVVVNLVRDVLDRGLRVAIGAETGYETLNECSLVVTEYLVDGEPAGSIGLLGPTRMDYSQAMTAVAVVGRELSSRLSEES